MIVISGALVLVALVLLIIGVVGPDLTFVYASIGVSLVSLVFLVIGILQRRGETAPAAETAAEAPAAQDEPSDAVTAVIPAQGRSARTRSEEPSVAETVDEELEVGGTVLVVEGRPRYHVDGCRYLSGKSAEEVDVLDAREEGFTPCGVCKPDEALEALADDELHEDEPAEADVAGEQEVVEEDVPGVEVPEPARRSSTRGRTAAAGPAAAGSARTAKAPAATPGTAPVKATKAATKAPAKTAAATKAPAKTAAASKAPAKAAAATAPAKAPAKAPARTAAVGRSRVATGQTPSKAAAAAVGSTPAAATAAARPGSVVVIPDRGRFHRADCRYVRDVPEAEVLTKSAASRSGYAACGVCKP